MPPRAPLSPPLLAVAGALAALPAAWLVLAADALVGGLAGSLVGFPFAGLTLSPRFIVVAVPPPAPAGVHPPLAWCVALLAGPVGAALLALAVHALVQGLRGAAWLRMLGLEAALFAVLRLPALLAAAVLPGRQGPVNQLYLWLGEPQSGRWALMLLALLALWGAGALGARLAVAAGRGWMRVDGRAFRRRLVRVAASFPALAALAAWAVLAPWAGPPWAAAWLALTFLAPAAFTR